MRLIPPRKNPSRDKLLNFIREASTLLSTTSTVLDAGAGEGMYQEYFAGSSYISIDLCKVSKAYGRISAISDLANIPFPTECFDAVICTQVLEHVNDPSAVLFELNRVLKTNGVLWLSAPFFYEQHEIPYDFYRYTQFGLIRLLEKSGFVLKRLEWLEGYEGALAYQLSTAARYYSSIKKNILFRLFFTILARYFSGLEGKTGRVEKLPPGYYGKNSIAIAEKVTTPDQK